MTQPLDLVGQKFGRLTVLERTENNKWGQSRWLCQCDCGNKTIVSGIDLNRGHTKSCGCYNLELAKERLPVKRTHLLSGTHLYNVWALMKQRCFNNNDSNYDNYGGRGITVCDEWLDSENFFEWAMSTGYENGKTLDRINNNGNYEPNNCKWSTPKEQGRNKRNNIHVDLDGETYVLSELAEMYDLPYPTVWQRYKQGDRGERLIRPIEIKHRPKKKP